jgi:hypothetical protein
LTPESGLSPEAGERIIVSSLMTPASTSSIQDNAASLHRLRSAQQRDRLFVRQPLDTRRAVAVVGLSVLTTMISAAFVVSVGGKVALD